MVKENKRLEPLKISKNKGEIEQIYAQSPRMLRKQNLNEPLILSYQISFISPKREIYTDKICPDFLYPRGSDAHSVISPFASSPLGSGMCIYSIR